MTTKIEGLLHVAGEQDRHEQFDHRRVAAGRQRRGFRCVVVAD